MSQRLNIAAVILAGGRATRMGGRDKGLLMLAGRPMLAHVIARLSPQIGDMALNANGNPERFANFNLPVLPDPIAGFPGPLAGVLAGMKWAASLGHDALVTVAADTPFLPDDLVDKLVAEPFAIAASLDDEGRLRQHPTVGLWPLSLREKLQRDLELGERKVGRWAAENGAKPVSFAQQPDPFFNVNTPLDLQLAEDRLG